MKYFSDLTFFHHCHEPASKVMSDAFPEFYSLNFCPAGQFWWSDGLLAPQILSGPVAWLKPPGLPLQYLPEKDKSWEYLSVSFDGLRLEAMRDLGLLKPVKGLHVVPLTAPEIFAASLTQLFGLLAQPGPPARAVHLLEDLLLQLHEQRVALEQLSTVEMVVNQWLSEVATTPEAPWNIEEVAAKLAISSGHLRRVVKKLAETSPYRFVLEKRLDRAAARLRESNDPIKTLALSCGFEDVGYFTRLFNERFHLPPARYRRTTRVVAHEMARLRRRSGLGGLG